MLKHIVLSTMHQAYASQSCVHEHLRVGLDGAGALQIWAGKEMPPLSLVLLPCGPLKEDGADAKLLSCPVRIEVEVEAGGPKAGLVFRIAAKKNPTRTVLGADKAVTLVPLWVLANRAASSAELSGQWKRPGRF